MESFRFNGWYSKCLRTSAKTRLLRWYALGITVMLWLTQGLCVAIPQMWMDHHPVTVLCAMEASYRLLDLYMIRSRIGYGTIVNKHPELEEAVLRAIRSSTGRRSEGDLVPESLPPLARFDSNGSTDAETSHGNPEVWKYFQDCEGNSEATTASPQDVDTILGKLTRITQGYDTGRAVHVAIRAVALIVTIFKCRQV
jgi:hypothetical protein